MKVTIVKKTKPYLWYTVGQTWDVIDFDQFYWKVTNRKKKYILKDDTEFFEREKSKYRIVDQDGKLYDHPPLDTVKDLKRYLRAICGTLTKEGFTIIRCNRHCLSVEKEGTQSHLFVD